jgi:hypothetical protein
LFRPLFPTMCGAASNAKTSRLNSRGPRFNTSDPSAEGMKLSLSTGPGTRDERASPDHRLHARCSRTPEHRAGPLDFVRLGSMARRSRRSAVPTCPPEPAAMMAMRVSGRRRTWPPGWQGSRSPRKATKAASSGRESVHSVPLRSMRRARTSPNPIVMPEMAETPAIEAVAEKMSAVAVALRMPDRHRDDRGVRRRPGSECAGRGVLAAA